jgi:hypothetical protein
MRILALIAILLIIPLASSVPVQMMAPLSKVVDTGDEVFIGTIGPGQTIDVQIFPYVYEGGIYGDGGQYDLAQVSAKPDGWSSEKSKLYGDPLQVKLTADKDAKQGIYHANITVIDEKNGHMLGNVTFRVRVNVTWDVLDFDVTPSNVVVGPGQPAQFKINVVNKGAASDTYTVSSSGARQWEFVKPIYIPAKSSREVIYEMVADEEEFYQPTIKVVSASSPNINMEKNVTFEVRSDLFGDYKATNNGVLLFPVFELPIYSLAGLISAVLEPVFNAFS